MEQYEQYAYSLVEQVSEHGMSYAIKFGLALVIFFVGRRLAKIIMALIVRAMRKNEVDPDLIGFIDGILYWTLITIVVIAALGQVGVQTASFIAVLGAAGLAVGLALQGSLSNFAAGILIIILRPFKVGDFIKTAGESGSVQAINVFTTELHTVDNKCVIIPNARVLNSNIINHSSTGTRRVDLEFGIGYDDDIDQAKRVLNEIVNADSRIHSEPAPLVGLAALADNSVNIMVKSWVDSSDYGAVKRDMLENVKKRFDAEGISFPYPQRTVHLLKEN